jgi:fructose-1,6-bisphosphatase/inositol monophosphatase family enzyme
VAPDPLLDTLLPVALEAAAHGADILRKRFGEARVDVRTKSSPTDMVSEVDREAESAVSRILAERRPDDGVLGEEGTSTTGTTGVRWVVDPLDGTTNFLFGVPSFAVSVAAQVDGEGAVGVVVDPTRAETWAAARGRGASLNGRPVRVSGAIATLDQALVATGFSYRTERRAWQARRLTAVLPAVRDIRRFGAAALDLCWVAGGRFSGFFEWGLQPWDLAAGTVIASEAGATLGSLADGTLLCACPALFDPLRLLLEGAADPAASSPGWA